MDIGKALLMVEKMNKISELGMQEIFLPLREYSELRSCIDRNNFKFSSKVKVLDNCLLIGSLRVISSGGINAKGQG